MSGPAVALLDELVPLIYRARWLRLFVSGQVTSREEGRAGSRTRRTGVPGSRSQCRAATGGPVAVRPAGPLPDGIGSVIDPAWLLAGYQLSTQGGRGRRAARAADRGRAGMAAAAGAAAGIAAGPMGGGRPDRGHRRRRARDHPAPRPPPGARIIHGGPLAETGPSPAEIAWHAAMAAPKLAIEIARRWISSR